MRKFVEIAALAFLLIAGAAIVAKSAEPTDDQRWDVYQTCRAKENEANNKLGLDFVGSALTGNFSKAIVDWAQMVVSTTPNFHCLDLLTPAQRKVAEAYEQCLAAYRDSARKGGYGNPFPCGDTAAKPQPAPPPAGHGGFKPPT